jgi:hypothetical protein
MVWHSHPHSGSLYTYIQKWVKFSSPLIGNFFVPPFKPFIITFGKILLVPSLSPLCKGLGFKVCHADNEMGLLRWSKDHLIWNLLSTCNKTLVFFNDLKITWFGNLSQWKRMPFRTCPNFHMNVRIHCKTLSCKNVYNLYNCKLGQAQQKQFYWSNLHSNKNFLTFQSWKPPFFLQGLRVGRLTHLRLLAWWNGTRECGSVGNKSQHSQHIATWL